MTQTKRGRPTTCKKLSSIPVIDIDSDDTLSQETVEVHIDMPPAQKFRLGSKAGIQEFVPNTSPATRKNGALSQGEPEQSHTNGTRKRKAPHGNERVYLSPEDDAAKKEGDGEYLPDQAKKKRNRSKKAEPTIMSLEDQEMLKQKCEKHRLEAKRLRLGGKSLRSQKADLKSDLNQLREEHKNLKERLKEKEDQINNLRKAHNDVQERLIQSSHSSVKSDGAVCGDFASLRSAWKTWVRKYGVTNLKGWDLETMVQSIKTFYPDSDAKPSNKVLRLLLAAPNGGRLFLRAALACEICKHVFSSPFFFLETFTEKDKPDRALEALHSVWQDAGDIHCKILNEWRVQTIKLLQPKIEELLPSDYNEIQRGREGQKADFYSKLASEILQSMQILLLPVDDTRARLRSDSLYKICNHACNLAREIWKHKACIEVVYPYGWPLFDKSNEIQLLNEVDLDEMRREGCEDFFVLEPLIRAWGDENGEHYNDYGVWAKATVWMPPPDSQSSSTTDQPHMPLRDAEEESLENRTVPHVLQECDEEQDTCTANEIACEHDIDTTHFNAIQEEPGEQSVERQGMDESRRVEVYGDLQPSPGPPQSSLTWRDPDPTQVTTQIYQAEEEIGTQSLTFKHDHENEASDAKQPKTEYQTDENQGPYEEEPMRTAYRPEEEQRPVKEEQMKKEGSVKAEEKSDEEMKSEPTITSEPTGQPQADKEVGESKIPGGELIESTEDQLSDASSEDLTHEMRRRIASSKKPSLDSPATPSSFEANFDSVDPFGKNAHRY